ncbi:hypothetical protein HC776_02455 [bacterium]|nr:hypothetical protein [bacterium]
MPNWHMLASIGRFDTGLFQMDLLDARRWMTLDDQPSVTFGGRRLNAYSATWPLPNSQRPPNNPPVMSTLPPLTQAPTVTLKPIGYDGCCWDYVWHPTEGRQVVYSGWPRRADGNRVSVVSGSRTAAGGFRACAAPHLVARWQPRNPTRGEWRQCAPRERRRGMAHARAVGRQPARH